MMPPHRRINGRPLTEIALIIGNCWKRCRFQPPDFILAKRLVEWLESCRVLTGGFQGKTLESRHSTGFLGKAKAAVRSRAIIHS